MRPRIITSKDTCLLGFEGELSLVALVVHVPISDLFKRERSSLDSTIT